MVWIALVVLVPLISALALALVPRFRLSAWLNAGASAITFLVSLPLFAVDEVSSSFFVLDAFNVYLVVLTAFVGLTTAIFSAGYIGHEVQRRKLKRANIRFYHAMYQAFMFTMLLALVANNLGVMWVAVEGATLATVLMVCLYRTAASIEAAWKYFILCGVGIALALFGTILMYMAAQPVLGPGTAAMTWTKLMAGVPLVNANILNLAFVFLLIGYGTKVGLAPLHAWLPDAHAEGPTPISAVLSGLLLNVALYAVLRFKMLLAANGQAIAPGPLMIGMGLSSLLLASFMLYRRTDVKRLFAYSSIEHMGLITFAFGMGGPLANFAGLLHMTMHSLTKSAIFFAVGDAVQATGTQKIADMRGLTVSHPLVGWGLLLGVVAIAGLPPFGIFMSEFLLVTTTFARQPFLAIPLVLGILLAFGALIAKVQGICFGAPSAAAQPLHGSRVPLYAHLALVLAAGVFLPGPLVAWFQAVAKLLG
jgi:hydrogenase-4 component F